MEVLQPAAAADQGGARRLTVDREAVAAAAEAGDYFSGGQSLTVVLSGC